MNMSCTEKKNSMCRVQAFLHLARLSEGARSCSEWSELTDWQGDLNVHSRILRPDAYNTIPTASL